MNCEKIALKAVSLGVKTEDVKIIKTRETWIVSAVSERPPEYLVERIKILADWVQRQKPRKPLIFYSAKD